MTDWVVMSRYIMDLVVMTIGWVPHRRGGIVVQLLVCGDWRPCGRFNCLSVETMLHSPSRWSHKNRSALGTGQ